MQRGATHEHRICHDLGAGHRGDVQVRIQTDLVPRVRGLLGAFLDHQGVGDARSQARERGGGLGHRLLLAHPGVHDLLWFSRRARPFAGRGDRSEDRAPRSDRAGRERRRRRLFDRRQSFPARLPAQCRPDLYRDGQSRLWNDQGPALADHRTRLGFQAFSRRHRSANVSSAGHRAGCRRELHRARASRATPTAPRRSWPKRSARRGSRSSKSCRRA